MVGPGGMLVAPPVGEVHEFRREKRVGDREQENERRHEIERIGGDALPEDLEQSGGTGRRVGVKRQRKSVRGLAAQRCTAKRGHENGGEKYGEKEAAHDARNPEPPAPVSASLSGAGHRGAGVLECASALALLGSARAQ